MTEPVSAMADIDIICVDSDGDSEERALLISDTEEDVIFVVKIDGRNSASNEIVDLSAPSFQEALDLTLPESGLGSSHDDTISSHGNTSGQLVDISDLLSTKVENACPATNDTTKVENMCLAPTDPLADMSTGTSLGADNVVAPDPLKSDILKCYMLESKSPSSPESQAPKPLVTSSPVISHTVDQHSSSLHSPVSLCTPATIDNHSDSSNTDVGYADSTCSDSDSSDLPSLNSPVSSRSQSPVSICQSDSDDNLPSLPGSPVNVPPATTAPTLNITPALTPTTPISPWALATPMFDKLLQFPVADTNAVPSVQTSQSASGKSKSKVPLVRPWASVPCKCTGSQPATGTNSQPSLATSSSTSSVTTTTTGSVTSEPNRGCKRSNDNLLLSMVPLKKRKPDITPREPKPSISFFDGDDDIQIIGEVVRPSGSSSFVLKHGECSQCEKVVEENLLLRCACSRHCCNECLGRQVESLLAKGQRGLPKCGAADCELILDLDKLNGFLPPMVMSILRKKIEEETIGDIKEWLMPRKEEAPRKDIEKVMDLPDIWEPMMEYEDYKLAQLSPDELEYIEVNNMFHLTMHGPRAQIQSIKRVQNPALWRFYAMKRHHMNRELSSVCSGPIERQLFHGTKREHTESICLDNFDWRMCGVHGTVYGMGTYFARDATYSHRYTDQPSSCSHGNGMRTIGSTVSRFLSNSSQVQASLFAHLGSQLAAPLMHGWQSFPPGLGPPNTITSSYVPTSQSNSVMMSTADPMLGQQPGSSGTKPKHRHVMFLAKVLTGRVALGKPNLRKPPVLEKNSTKYYDACVNCLQNPSIYVVFEKSQCYPEYVIEYTNDTTGIHI